jgi:predicted aldo/keto reductase-like oxidoreductase
VAEAFGHGVNYFDVAPSYGNAIERLGPALKPYRDRVFLACKTMARDAAGAEKELNQSLGSMQTDHFDLYQLHALSSVDEVDKALGPGGALEAVIKAREAGKVRHIGFSAHSEEAAISAMDRFHFDTILFPFNFASWYHGQFGPAVYRRASDKGMGLLALKSMAHQPWGSQGAAGTPWNKCWYQPLDNPEKAGLALRFTLGLPVTAAIPPGHWPLFKMALDFASSGPVERLRGDERESLREFGETSKPLFPLQKKA